MPHRRVAIGGASYCWATPEHPDPEGNSFLALAEALKEALRNKADGGPYQHFPSEIGIFWDYPCLFQHPQNGKRSEEEEELFKWALSLRNLDLIYAHEKHTRRQRSGS